jgi:hypothetical protein
MHGQDGVGGRNARPAVHTHWAVARHAAGAESVRQHRHRSECAGVGHIAGGREVDRPGDVTGDRVYRLHLPTEPFRSPHVNEPSLCGKLRCRVSVQYGQAARAEGRSSGAHRRHLRLHRTIGCRPGSEPPIQHPHRAQPRPPQHPPRSGRRDRVGAVVDDDLTVLIDPPFSDSSLQTLRVRQRVTSALGWWVGEITVEIAPSGTRNVSGEVGIELMRTPHLPPHIK